MRNHQLGHPAPQISGSPPLSSSNTPHRSKEVDLEAGLCIVYREIKQRSTRSRSSIVDQHINPSLGRDDPIHSGLARDGVRDVEHETVDGSGERGESFEPAGGGVDDTVAGGEGEAGRVPGAQRGQLFAGLVVLRHRVAEEVGGEETDPIPPSLLPVTRTTGRVLTGAIRRGKMAEERGREKGRKKSWTKFRGSIYWFF